MQLLGCANLFAIIFFQAKCREVLVGVGGFVTMKSIVVLLSERTELEPLFTIKVLQLTNYSAPMVVRKQILCVVVLKDAPI